VSVANARWHPSTAAQRAPLWLRARLDSLLLASLVGVLLLTLAWLVLPPLFFIVQTSFSTARGPDLGVFTLENYRAVLGSLAAGQRIIPNTLVFAVGSAGLAIILGTALAWLAERTNSPFRSFAYLAAFVSFAMPGVVKVIAWILLLGPKAGFVNVWLMGLFNLQEPPLNIFSMAGMIFLEGLLWMPVVFLLLATPFRSMDPALEDAAATSGAGFWMTFRRVTLPLATPSTLAVLFLTLVRSLEAFEIPALVGVPAGVDILSAQIYLEVRKGAFPRYGEAGAYAAVLLVLVCVALYPYYRLTLNSRKFATVTGKGFLPRVLDLGRWRYLGGALLLVLPAFELLPLLAIAWTAFMPFPQLPSAEALGRLTLANFPTAFYHSNASASLQNSLIVSAASATAVVLLTLFAGWVVTRASWSGRWILDLLASLPLVFPGVVLGLALLRLYLIVPIPVYGTVWILVLAYVCALLPYGMRFTYAGLLTIDRELEDSASVSGATFLQTLRRIVFPLLFPALFAAWIYTFLVTMKVLSVALMLYSHGSQVVPVAIWELWNNGAVTELSAFSLVFTCGLLILAFVLHRVSSTFGSGAWSAPEAR
jgi:iron(III) transport system permease protein